MIRLAAAASVAITLTAASASASAQCFARRPGDPPQCPERSAVSATAPQTLAARTHVGITPTGSTLSEGQMQYQIHDLIWNRLSYGLSDRLELGADFAHLVAGIGARLQITPPDSRVKLTAGGGMFGGLGVSGYQGSLTAGYHGDATSIYGTANGFIDDDPNDSLYVFMYQVGIARQVSPRGALVAYGGRFAMVDSGDAADVLHAAGAGYKYMGERWDVDISAVFPIGLDDGEDVTPLPMLSFSYRN